MQAPPQGTRTASGTSSAGRRCDVSQACKGTRLKPRRKLAGCSTGRRPVRVHARERPGRTRSGSWIGAVLTCSQANTAGRHESGTSFARRFRSAATAKEKKGRPTDDGDIGQGKGRREDGQTLEGATPRTPLAWNTAGRPVRRRREEEPDCKALEKAEQLGESWTCRRLLTRARIGNDSGSGRRNPAGWEPWR